MAEQYLTAKELAAFCGMSRAEQLHSLRVLQVVLEAAREHATGFGGVRPAARCRQVTLSFGSLAEDLLRYRHSRDAIFVSSIGQE